MQGRGDGGVGGDGVSPTLDCDWLPRVASHQITSYRYNKFSLTINDVIGAELTWTRASLQVAGLASCHAKAPCRHGIDPLKARQS